MHGTAEDVLREFQKLTPQQLGVLVQYAKRRLCAPYSEPLDLVYEALGRSVDGRRRWPRNIPFSLHMIQSVRSISGHGRKKAENDAAKSISIDAENKESGITALIPSAEERAILRERFELAREVYGGARRELANDAIASTILDAIVAGLSPQETRARYAIHTREFDAGWHRMTRKLRSNRLRT